MEFDLMQNHLLILNFIYFNWFLKTFLSWNISNIYPSGQDSLMNSMHPSSSSDIYKVMASVISSLFLLLFPFIIILKQIPDSVP